MMSENKKEKVEKKVWFAENVKLPMEVGVMNHRWRNLPFVHQEHVDQRF